MNILQISQSDAGGGAARVAWNMHESFTRLGHAPTMLVGHKQTDDARVRSIKRHVGWRAADRLTGAVTDRLSLQYVFYPSSFAVAYDRWFRGADVVQLHNLHGSYFSYSALPLLSRRRPVVWLLHDQWPLTGHIAYSLDCERWRHGCGGCPYVDHLPALRRDTTALLWRWKRRVYGASKLTIVAPSRWLAGLARESPLLSRFRIELIPYGVDAAAFAPRPREEARARLGIAADRRVVLFVSEYTTVPRKGLHLLEQALQRLDERPLLLVAGGGPLREGPEVQRAASLEDAYAAADIVAHPSLADNFPNVVIESLACGVPVVAFDVGGVRDAVRHGENGWLAPSGDVEALAEGLRTFLADGELRARAGSAGREFVERELTLERQANAFLDLYAELAQDHPDVEYLVVDGGSTDGSVDVIRRYEDRLAWWTSEPDRGQAEAVNRGFARGTGDLLTWVNSDDTLLPGAVSRLVEEFERDPELVLVYGDAVYTDDDSQRLGPLVSRPWDVPIMLRTFECHVVQPASMFSRRAWEQAGPLREDLDWFFDYAFFMRVSRVGKAKQIRETLATYRLHPASKSVGEPLRRARSLERLAHDLPATDAVPRGLVRATRSGGLLAAGEDFYAALEVAKARRCFWRGLATYPPNATPRKLALAVKSLLPRPVIARLRSLRAAG